MKEVGYVGVSLIVVYAIGFIQGACFGFVWRAVYDDWFSRVWWKLLGKFGITRGRSPDEPED